MRIYYLLRFSPASHWRLTTGDSEKQHFCLIHKVGGEKSHFCLFSPLQSLQGWLSVQELAPGCHPGHPIIQPSSCIRLKEEKIEKINCQESERDEAHAKVKAFLLDQEDESNDIFSLDNLFNMYKFITQDEQQDKKNREKSLVSKREGHYSSDSETDVVDTDSDSDAEIAGNCN